VVVTQLIVIIGAGSYLFLAMRGFGVSRTNSEAFLASAALVSAETLALRTWAAADISLGILGIVHPEREVSIYVARSLFG
jgi:hypothetical protein